MSRPRQSPPRHDGCTGPESVVKAGLQRPPRWSHVPTSVLPQQPGRVDVASPGSQGGEERPTGAHRLHPQAPDDGLGPPLLHSPSDPRPGTALLHMALWPSPGSRPSVPQRPQPPLCRRQGPGPCAKRRASHRPHPQGCGWPLGRTGGPLQDDPSPHPQMMPERRGLPQVPRHRVARREEKGPCLAWPLDSP